MTQPEVEAPVQSEDIRQPETADFTPESSDRPLTLRQEKECFARLEALLEKLPPEPDPDREDLPRRALEVAISAHSHQRRISGEPYVYHPLTVAELVADLVPDRATVMAALLHDLFEDTDYPVTDIEREFGEEVVFLVNGVTNVSRIPFGLRAEKQIENLRRLLVATAKDLRVIFIKLCDRLHNMRTLGALSSQKRRRICQSTLDVFAPLAHRLGLERIKNELEDLCLLYLHPEVYREIKQNVDERLAERQEYAKRVQHIIADVLATHGLEAKVQWRVKHFWSIYRKMQRDSKEFAEIYDLTGIRILVDTVDHCYRALGIIHGVWPQVPGRFKDYISRPKPNDYRSIHTTVLGPERRMLEIQLRTEAMHRVCEEGVAAHWRYKERGRSSKRLGDDAAWIGQMSGILQELRNQDEWSDTIKTDLFSDEAYCYTPKGDIVRLPTGSTPIDFAYHIHTELGQRCQGARVNGRYVPLSHPLKTGDVVEIQTGKNAHPTSDWLNVVKSARARSKIRSYLYHSNREGLEEQGRLLLTRELHRIGEDPATFLDSKLCRQIMSSLVGKSIEVNSAADLYAQIGFGRIATKQITTRVLQSRTKEKKPVQRESGDSIKVSDIDDLMYRLAKCCHPMPGEEIVGLVTRGRGISIHRVDCRNIVNFRGDEARLIPLQWEESEDAGSTTQIIIEAIDRSQLLADVTNVISSAGANIRASISELYGKDRARLCFTVRIRDIRHLRRVASLLIEVRGVLSISERRGKRLIPLG